MGTVSVKVEKSGRILLPAAVRRKLNLREGSRVLLHVDETGIQIGTRDQVLAEIRRELRHHVPEGRSLSEELIQERRAEAEREKRH